MAVIFSALTIGLMVGALVDIIILDSSRVQFLAKGLWLILVILLPLIGSILWFALGRTYPAPSGYPRTPGRGGMSREASSPRDSGIPLGPRDTATELAALEREIAAHERSERIRDLEAELEAKRREKGSKA